MIIKGRSPLRRHVSGTHGVAFDWFCLTRSNSNMLTPTTQLADVLTKASFTRDELVQSSSSVQLHEFLYVHSQPFSFRRKGNHYVEENSRKEQARRTCESKSEVSVFDFNKLEQGATLFLRSGCFQCPGESAAGFRICAKELLETATKQKPQQHVLKCGKKPNRLKGVAGTCNQGLKSN